MSAPKLTYPEPRGHGSAKSKIEALWDVLPSGYSLVGRRTEAFDTSTGMTFAPILSEAFYIADDLPSDSPSNQWCVQALNKFVKGEFGSLPARGSYPGLPTIKTTSYESAPSAAYLASCEAELVYSGVFTGLRGRDPRDVAQAVLDVLCDPDIGNKENATFLDRDQLEKRLLPLIEKRERLQFILPALPFKDQNPFRTSAAPHEPDYADLAFLVRLHALALALFQVHPYGADWIVLSDGQAYADALYVDRTQASRYLRQLTEWRNRLNLQGTVSLLDLRDLAKRSDGEAHGRFESLEEGLEKRLVELEQVPAVAESLAVLARGLAWNMSSREFLDSNSEQQLWSALNEPWAVAARDESEPYHSIRVMAYSAARKYAAFNLAMAWLGLPDRFFPNALRATVHPKPGQVGVPTLGTGFPWNGVCVVNGLEEPNLRNVSVHPLYRVQAGVPEDAEIECVRDASDRKVLYYRVLDPSEDRQEQAPTAASIVASIRPLEAFSIGDLRLRPFEATDLDHLQSSMSGDALAAWERREMTDAEVEALLEFRLAHYRRYGFGPLRLSDSDDNYLGQVGLQVLDHNAESVEFVAFLDRAARGQGFGERLAKWFIGEAFEAGVSRIFATTRLENEVAEALASALGFERTDRITHFGFLASLWVIDQEG